MDNPYKRSRSPVPDSRGRTAERQSRGSGGNYQSRWSLRPSENIVLNLIGVPTTIYGALSSEQLDAFQVLLRIEEISTRLKINDFVPSDNMRSPSPPPEYDNMGKRINTRQLRYRKKLEDERHRLIEHALKTTPQYKPPIDYRKPSKTVEKVYIPVKDNPDVNFIGLLLGPRGNTLKRMQQESGARIQIRGKGSVKGGKNPVGISSAQNDLEDDLHCLITSESEEKIITAVSLVNSVIEKALNAPVGQNELKRSQLRDLAVLNGTLRVQHDDGRPCPICGMPGHRRWACPNKDSRNAIICNLCGNPGHIERDCRYRNAPPGGSNNIDNEINQFMKDLNGDGAGDDQQPHYQQEEEELPPWKRRKENDSVPESNKYYYNLKTKTVVPNKRKGPPGLSSVSSSGIVPPPPPPPGNIVPPPPPPPHVSKPTPPPPPQISKPNPPPPPSRS